MNLAVVKTCLLMFGVPNVPNEYAGSGYLSSSYGPFGLGSDPQGRFQGPRSLLPKDMTGDRFSKRRSLLDTVDDHFRNTEDSDALGAMDKFLQRCLFID